MQRKLIPLLAGALFLGAPAVAEDTPAEEAPTEQAEADPKARFDLPAVADRLRKDGVDEGQVKEALEAAKAKGLKASESAEVLEEADKAAKEHGPVDNFGAFVKGKLDEGLRGKELAAAIRAEHEANGKKHKEDKGKPEDAGKPDGAGKPDMKGPKPGGARMGAGKGGKAGGGKGGKAGGGK